MIPLYHGIDGMQTCSLNDIRMKVPVMQLNDASKVRNVAVQELLRQRISMHMHAMC